MTIKVEIYTDIADYVAELADEEATGTMEAWKHVKDAITSGMPLYGYIKSPTLEIAPRYGLFSIEPGSLVKHIFVGEERSVEAVEPPTTPSVLSPVLGVRTFMIEGALMGSRVSVVGLALRSGRLKTDYYMPTKANGERAADVVSPHNLGFIVNEWAGHEAHEGKYVVVLPPEGLDTLDLEEAEAYLKDFVASHEEVEETADHVNRKTAKAWQGWKGEKA